MTATFETITKDAFGFADKYFDGNDLMALKRYYGADSAHGVVFKAWQECKDAETRQMLVEEMSEIRNYRDALNFIWGERDDAGMAWDAPISSEELIEVLYPVEN